MCRNRININRHKIKCFETVASSGAQESYDHKAEVKKTCLYFLVAVSIVKRRYSYECVKQGRYLLLMVLN